MTERPNWRPAREIRVTAACGTGALSAPRMWPRTGIPPEAVSDRGPEADAVTGAVSSPTTVATVASRSVPSVLAAQLGTFSSAGAGNSPASSTPTASSAAWARPPEVRSGTSLMNITTMKAISAKGAA